MDTDSIGQTVRWARKRAGMTQQQLALAVDMPQASIARIEAASVIPRTATLIAVLEATGHQLVAEPIGESGPREAIRQRLAIDTRQRR